MRSPPQAARCEDASLPPDFADVAAVQATIQAAETAQALAFEHRHHRAQLSEALVALLDKGRAVDAETLLAQHARAERWRGEIDALFERCDVLLAPSAVDEAPEGLQFTGDPIFCRPVEPARPAVRAPALRHRFDRAAGGPATGRPPRRRPPPARRSAVVVHGPAGLSVS